MITITKKPPAVALCDNKMLFEITTNLPIGTEGVYVVLDPAYHYPPVALGSERIYPAVPGSADANLSEYYRSGMFEPKQFLWPEDTVSYELWAGLSKRYTLLASEVYIDSGIQQINQITLDHQYVVRGRIPRWKWAAFYNTYTSFKAWIEDKHPFLTLSPKIQTTRTDQVQKLFFMAHWTPGKDEYLSLKVVVTFTDGTTATYLPALQTAGLSQIYEIYEFPCGYTALGLATWVNTNHSGKTVASYTVTVMLDEAEVSETRTFIIDRKAYHGMHQFIFANSVGGYDTLMARGNSELNSAYDYEVADVQSPGIKALPDKRQLFADDTDVMTCRTGFLTKAEAEYIAEFFISHERYEISGSAITPIVLRNAKVLRKRDTENLFFAEFEYEYALNQTVETV